MKKIASLVLASCVLSGCFLTSMFSDGSTVDMTYSCSPAGATIIEQGGNKLGTCPVTVQYHPNSDQIKEGKFYTKKLTAIWADGSVSSVPSLTVDIPTSHQAQYTFMNSGDTQQVAWNAPDNYGTPPSPPPAPPTFDSGSSMAPVPLSNQMVSGDGDYRMAAPSVVPEHPMNNGQGAPAVVHQDNDVFQGFNRKVTCELNNQIDSNRSGCSQDEGIKEFKDLQ